MNTTAHYKYATTAAGKGNVVSLPIGIFVGLPAIFVKRVGLQLFDHGC
jgi:hypothetical protein